MYRAVYAYGLEPEEQATPTGHFICTPVERFLKKLTDLPELEMALEKVKVSLTPEDTAALLRALPLCVGDGVCDRAMAEKDGSGIEPRIFRGDPHL